MNTGFIEVAAKMNISMPDLFALAIDLANFQRNIVLLEQKEHVVIAARY